MVSNKLKNPFLLKQNEDHFEKLPLKKNPNNLERKDNNVDFEM